MIKYSLSCKKGHEFESWFSNSDAFDGQVRAGLVECPFCGSTKVEKALMAPSVSTSRKKEAQALARRQSAMQRAVVDAASAPDAARTGAGAGSAPAAPAGSAPLALLDEDQRKLRESIRELHAKVTENTVDVGDQFASEARKIHDGDAPERAIRGQASLKQAKELWDDGIAVLPLPALPEGKN